MKNLLAPNSLFKRVSCVALMFISLSNYCSAQCERVDVFFKTNKKSAAKEFEKFKKVESKQVASIKAYSDTLGPKSYNLKLSEKRARYIEGMLQNNGFDLSNAKVEWFGELVDDMKDSKRVEVSFCSKSMTAAKDSVEPFNLDNLKEKKQVFNIRNNTDSDTILYGKRGTAIYIPRNAFNASKKKSIRFELTEYYSRSQMILNGLTTTSGDEAIETGGMVKIEAFQDTSKLSLNKSKELRLVFPLTTKNEGFQTFNGEHGHDDVINWVPRSGGNRNNESRNIVSAYCYKKRFPKYFFSEISENETKEINKFYEERKRTNNYSSKLNDFRSDNYWFVERSNKKVFDKSFEDLYSELLKADKLPGGFISFELNKTSKAKNYDFSCAKNCNDSTIQKFDSLLYWDRQDYFGWKYGGFGISFHNPTDIRTSKSHCILDLNYKLYMRNSKLADEILAVLAKNNSTDIEALDAAVLYTSKLGMVNCDRFLRSKRTLKNLVVKNGDHEKMYLIYKNIKSILPPTIEGKTIKFLNVPLNEPIIILGVKENNGEVKVAKKEYNFNGKSTELNNYETVSLEEFKDLMNNLDKI